MSIGRKPPTVSNPRIPNPFSAEYAAEHEHGTNRVPPRPLINAGAVSTRADRHRRNRKPRAPLPRAHVVAPWWRRLWACIVDAPIERIDVEDDDDRLLMELDLRKDEFE